MQATRGRTTDIEQQNLTVPAKKRSGFLADVAEVEGHCTTSCPPQHACASQVLLCNNKQHRFGLSSCGLTVMSVAACQQAWLDRLVQGLGTCTTWHSCQPRRLLLPLL